MCEQCGQTEMSEGVESIEGDLATLRSCWSANISLFPWEGGARDMNVKAEKVVRTSPWLR
jgi:hypothetical protein